ncbi:ubiquitin-like-conjugating enzyme ATG10 isoform X1 [Lactuca sativa]|nr:ubiquitin-like-conjugating enzyme ATG10 isoform X1 [Lactuca sativa]
MYLAAMASDQATLDGSLSSTDFQNSANAFAQKWNEFNSGFPEWSWIDCSSRLGFHRVTEGYLSLQHVFFPRSIEEEHDEGNSNDHQEPFDTATLVQSNNDSNDGDWYDFHVVYSSSYRVPVLYFHAQTSDGQPLNVGEIEKNLPTKSSDVLMDSKWTFITQQEHPYLNRPWYMLHPCGTSEWMKLLLADHNSTDRYLVSWFTVVGQVFGLKLPLEMLKS